MRRSYHHLDTPHRSSIFSALAILAAALIPLPAHGQSPIAPGRAEQAPLDVPLSWLHEARRNYTAVKDYTCTLMSQENVRGKMHEQNVISLKVKTQPFSIHMRWLSPRESQGQEVIFVLGKNNNKMRVKSNHIGKNLIGFMSIDPNDPRVLEHSRHNITEAGIGNMIERTIGQWEVERRAGKTQVRMADFSFDQHECHRIETIRMDRNNESYCHRSVIFLEKTSKMPIRLENYDWPRAGGPPEGELLEVFSYVNLRWNVGLKDEEFNR
jgi:hypothetical protein